MVATPPVPPDYRFDFDVIGGQGENNGPVVRAAVNDDPVVFIRQTGQCFALRRIGQELGGPLGGHFLVVGLDSSRARDKPVLRAEVGQLVAASEALVPHTVAKEVVLAPGVGLEGGARLPSAASHDVKCGHGVEYHPDADFPQ